MNEICEICRQNLKDDEEIYICPKCEQDFHLDHMKIWLKEHKGCPVCKFKLDQTKIRPIIHNDRDLISSNPKTMGYGLTNIQKENYEEAQMEMLNFEDILGFSSENTETFRTKYLEPVTVSFSNGHIRISQPIIGLFRRYLLSQRWNFILGIAIYFVYTGGFSIFYGELLVGFFSLIISIPIFLFYRGKNDKYFLRLFDGYFSSRNKFHTVIGDSVKTDFSKYFVKTINPIDIDYLRTYDYNKIKYPCIVLQRNVPVVLGNNYTIFSPKQLEQLLPAVSNHFNLKIRTDVENINYWGRIIKTDQKALIERPSNYWDRYALGATIFFSPSLILPLLFLDLVIDGIVLDILFEILNVIAIIIYVSWFKLYRGER